MSIYCPTFTDNASHKAWDRDPKSFPEVDGIVRVAISTAPVGITARLDSNKERDDGEVDEEDDAESDQ